MLWSVDDGGFVNKISCIIHFYVVITGDCPVISMALDYYGLSCDIHQVHDRIIMFMLVEGVVYARHGLAMHYYQIVDNLELIMV